MALMVLIIPFVGFFINSTIIRILFGSESLISGYINSLFIGISLLLSLIILFNPSDITNQINVTWLNLFDLNITFGLLIDPLTSIMMVVVSGISFLVQIYSLGYMHGDKSYTRYFAYMSLFTGSMLGLVMSRNILQLFIFWELVGVTSYLLIGFWYKKATANAAAIKAFIVNRVGDFGFAIGIFLIFFFYGTVNYNEVFEQTPMLNHKEVILLGIQFKLITLICLFLFKVQQMLINQDCSMKQ